MDPVDNITKEMDVTFEHEEAGTKPGSPSSIITFTSDQKLLRRIDFHVLPPLCLLYALSLIDRTNIASASIAGLTTDLKLVGNQYSITLLAFFPTYILAEIPSNMIVRRLKTRYYLTGLILSFGIIAMCQGFIKSFAQLTTLRILLGIFEGAFNVS